MENITKLTPKEEEIMLHFWKRGALFVKDFLTEYEDPKPHINTISTIVRGLEARGFLSHEAYGSTYKYFPIISKKEFNKLSLKSVINKYFNNNALSAVSTLVEEENISTSDLKELIELIEKSKK